MTRYAPQWLQAQTYAASVDRRLIGALWPAPASAGCAVTAASAMTVNIAAGQVAAPTPNNTGSTLCTSDAVEQVTLTAAPGSGTNRIDLVICRPRGNDLDGGANNDFIFDFVAGTPAATPAAPAVPAGTVALAQILVPGGSASISPANITDIRPGGMAVAGYAAFSIGAGAGQTITANTAQKLLAAWSVAPTFNYGPGTWSGGVYTVGARSLLRVTFQCAWTLGTAFASPNCAFGAQIFSNGSVVANGTTLYVVNLGTGVVCQTRITKTLLALPGDLIDFRAFNGHPTINFGVGSGATQTYAEIEQLPVAA